MQKRLSVLLAVFLADRRGAVAILGAFALIPLLLAIGGGIDYMRVMAMRTELQNAVDSAALAAMASQSDAAAAGNAAGVAENYIRQNFPDPNAAVTTTLNASDNTTTVTAKANVPTTFLGLVNVQNVSISASATATMGSSAGKPLEVALVMDVTQSMNDSAQPGDKDNKLVSAKAAATDLVTKIYGKLGGRVRFGLAPFSELVAVNVPAFRGAWWLNKAGKDWTRTYDYCSWVMTGSPKCTNGAWQAKTCYNDGVPFDCGYYAQICTGGTKTWECKNYTQTYVWKGCLGSRASPLDVQEGPTQVQDADSAASDKVPQSFYGNCNQISSTIQEPSKYLTDTVGQLRRLADYDVSSPDKALASRDRLIEEIASLKESGSTDLSSGLLWGWNLLSPLSPFADGKPYGEAMKVLIFLTDGSNTVMNVYPDKFISAEYTLDKKIVIDPNWPQKYKDSIQKQNDYYDQQNKTHDAANEKR